jgi:hypothetical protein
MTDLPNTSGLPTNSGGAAVVDDSERAVTDCPCGHWLDDHDPIALRFCRATSTGDLTRSCICHTPAVPVPWR